MELTSQDKQRVQQSFARIAPRAEELARRFYTRLFEVAPERQKLFEKMDIDLQSSKFMHTVASAVAALDLPDDVQMNMYELGKRHKHYGVSEADYDLVGDVLIWSIAQMIPDDFDDDTRIAWEKVYVLLSKAAIKGHE